MMTAMTLDKIKTETTWNDASASINSNFAKILQALGGNIPEGGGSIDPELLEGYMPMMREFSDDFNNDFTR